MRLGALDGWVGERNKKHEFGVGPWTAVRQNMLNNGLGAVFCWVQEKNKNTEFWVEPWAAVKSTVEQWDWAVLTVGSGEEIKTLSLGWVLGLQLEGSC